MNGRSVPEVRRCLSVVTASALQARNVVRTSYKPLLLSQGIHPKIVAEMLGHTTISMTLDMQQEAADTMDRLFWA